MTRLALVFALLAAGCGAAFAEQFYKWQDETGAWHYTTTPPKGTSATTVHVSGGRARTRPERGDIDVAAPARSDPTGAAPTGEAPAPNSAAAVLARRASACDNARQRLEVLQNNAAVEWDRDGDGVAEPLDVATHAAEIDRAKTDVSIYCKR